MNPLKTTIDQIQNWHLSYFFIILIICDLTSKGKKVIMQFLMSEDSYVLHTGSSVDILETMAT